MLTLELVARAMTSPVDRCVAVCTCKWMAALAKDIIIPPVTRKRIIGRNLHVYTRVGRVPHGPGHIVYNKHAADVRYVMLSFWDGVGKRIATTHGKCQPYMIGTITIQYESPHDAYRVRITKNHPPTKHLPGDCGCRGDACIQCVRTMFMPTEVCKIQLCEYYGPGLCSGHTALIRATFERGDEMSSQQLNPAQIAILTKFALLPGCTQIDWAT